MSKSIFKIISLILCIVMVSCTKYENEFEKQLLEHKEWKLLFITSEQDFNQESIVEFQKNNLLKINEPIKDEIFYKILNKTRLYIGDTAYKDNNSVRKGNNSWIIEFKKVGSSFIGKVVLMNEEDEKIIGNIPIKLTLNKVK